MNTEQKHKILLSNLKKYYKEDDDIWDRDLINKTIAEYFVLEEFKGNRKIKQDNHKSKFNLIVRTRMFGWCAKHIDWKFARDFWKQLYNLI